MATISYSVLLAAVRQCVTVVQPGEVLAVRVAAGTDDLTMDLLGAQAARIRDEHGVAVLFLAGEEFARVKAGGA